jgi:Transglutaminase-like superfamily
MRRLHKFLLLPLPTQCLLIMSALLLAAIRLGLWLLPFQTLRRLLARISHLLSQLPKTAHPSVHNIAWAMAVVTRRVPVVGTCLTQALATQILLGWRGHPTHLRIGVAYSETGQLQAHAWIESGGKIVVGDLSDLSRYHPLPLEGE